MTYATFRTLYTNAKECTNLSDYIHQNTKAMEDEFGKETKLLLKAVWELSEDYSAACLFRVCARTQASVYKAYDMPRRTVQAWVLGEKKPHDYNLSLLAADMLTETFGKNRTFSQNPIDK